MNNQTQELRFYSFVNALYTREVQHGIQSAHAMAELFNKVANNKDDVTAYRTVFDWSENHKTMIILNGGIVEDLLEKELFFENNEIEFHIPFASFREDQKSLGGIITAIGCVVPEIYYNAISKVKLIEMRDKNLLDVRKNTFNISEIQNIDDEFLFWVHDGIIKKVFSNESPEGKFILMLKSCDLAR